MDFVLLFFNVHYIIVEVVSNQDLTEFAFVVAQFVTSLFTFGNSTFTFGLEDLTIEYFC